MNIVFVHSAAFPVYDVLARLTPHRLLGASKIRLGRSNDGGYVMLDDFQGIDAAFSIGINDDVSWDRDIVSRKIPVFQYDHTIADTPLRHELMHWRQIGLGPKADAEARLNTLAGMLAENGQDRSRNLILKCDIEGHEWATLANTSSEVLDQFRQIAMEVHAFEYLNDVDIARNVKASIERLTTTHYMVHVHANNYSSWNVNTGVPLPNVLEMTFVRKDLGRFEPSGEIFPTALDMPCNPDAPDYYLGSFTFAPPGTLTVDPARPAGRDYIASSYELFLGRELDSDAVVRDRGGWPEREVLKSVMGSSEFAASVLRPMQLGQPFPDDLFQGRPSRRLRYWAADRLPITWDTRKGVETAAEWRELMALLISDPQLLHEAGLPEALPGAA